jgi:hypothetical protein
MPKQQNNKRNMEQQKARTTTGKTRSTEMEAARDMSTNRNTTAKQKNKNKR